MFTSLTQPSTSLQTPPFPPPPPHRHSLFKVLSHLCTNQNGAQLLFCQELLNKVCALTTLTHVQLGSSLTFYRTKPKTQKNPLSLRKVKPIVKLRYTELKSHEGLECEEETSRTTMSFFKGNLRWAKSNAKSKSILNFQLSSSGLKIPFPALLNISPFLPPLVPRLAVEKPLTTIRRGFKMGVIHCLHC